MNVLSETKVASRGWMISSMGILCRGLFIFYLAVEAKLLAAERTWIGGSSSINWTAPANWENGGVPVDRDDVVMVGPGNASNRLNNRNLNLDALLYPLGAPSFTTEIEQAGALGLHIHEVVI